MNPRYRSIVLSAALLSAILLVGAWPYKGVADAFSRMYCPLADVGLSWFRFGNGGRVRLAHPPEMARRPGDSVDADALLILSVEGIDGELPLGVSLRRDVYLPWLILVALLAAAPIAPICRVAGPLIAAPIVWASSVGSYALLAMWMFATQLRGIYDLSETAQRLTHFAHGALLSPPGNRFIGPVAVGLLIILFTRRRVDKPRPIATARE